MITVTNTEGGGFDLAAEVRPPGVYLDQDSLGDIARTDARSERFLKALHNKGTLLFSWTNAFDLSGPQGRSADKIREFVCGVGTNWFPLEMNPWRVVRKESGVERAAGAPSFSETFLQAYLPQVVGGPLNLGRVVELIQNDRARVQNELNEIKTRADGLVQRWRQQYLRDQSRLDEMLPPETYDPGRPTAFVLRNLERLVTLEAQSFTWTPNDGIDFMHSAVAAACADLLVVDKQWKRRVLEVSPERSRSWVYYRAELDTFLEAFELFEVA